MAAVRQRGWALNYASPELRADREVVLAAVRQNGRALEFAIFASEELRADMCMHMHMCMHMSCIVKKKLYN